MTTTTIRRMPTEDMLEAMFPITSYAFRSSPPFPDEEEWRKVVRQREGVIYFALFEDEVPVATVAGTAMTQRVREKLYDMGGIWGVATRPAARRKGYSKRLMARLLAALRADGLPLSCLYPFRESFYERLGYVSFPVPCKATLHPSALLPLLKQDLGGTIELVMIRDGYDSYRDFVYQMQQRIHGMSMFVHDQKALAEERNSSWVALAQVDGEPAGLMLYNLKGEAETEFKMTAYRFYYETSQAKYMLLQWIALHVDQANEVEIWLPAFEHPEMWLADIEVKTEPQTRAPMGRVVDVADIGGMQTGPGRFSARVADPLCPWNEGLWHFESVDGILQVRAANEADCDLSIHALAALIYGTHDPGDFPFRGWGNPSPAVQTTMRSMFPRMLPHLHEYF